MPSVGVLLTHQLAFERRIAVDADAVHRLASLPDRVDILAQLPVEVIDDDRRAARPGRPFIMLAAASAGLHFAKFMGNVLQRLRNLELHRNPLDFDAQRLGDHRHRRIEELVGLWRSLRIGEQLVAVGAKAHDLGIDHRIAHLVDDFGDFDAIDPVHQPQQGDRQDVAGKARMDAAAVK